MDFYDRLFCWTYLLDFPLLDGLPFLSSHHFTFYVTYSNAMMLEMLSHLKTPKNPTKKFGLAPNPPPIWKIFELLSYF